MLRLGDASPVAPRWLVRLTLTLFVHAVAGTDGLHITAARGQRWCGTSVAVATRSLPARVVTPAHRHSRNVARRSPHDTATCTAATRGHVEQPCRLAAHNNVFASSRQVLVTKRTDTPPERQRDMLRAAARRAMRSTTPPPDAQRASNM